MIEAAALGYLLDCQSGFGLQKVSCPLHLDSQHVGGGRVSRDGHKLPMELARTHAELLCQGVHVQTVFVHKLIDEIHRLGQEATLGIGEA